MINSRPILFCVASTFLAGCSQPPKAAVQTPTSQPHQFALFQAQAELFLIDTAQGSVWRLEGDHNKPHFVPIDVAAVRGVGNGMSAEECAKAQAEAAKYGGFALCTSGDASALHGTR